MHVNHIVHIMDIVLMLYIIGKGDRTALTLASGYGHLEVVRLLIDRGADIHHKSHVSNTPSLTSADATSGGMFMSHHSRGSFIHGLQFPCL